MEYYKVDPKRNSRPKSRLIGWCGMRIFDLLLDISAKYDLGGVIPIEYLDSDFLADEWGMMDETARKMGYDSGPLLVSDWLNTLLEASSLQEDPIVTKSGTDIVITGWETRYGSKKTSTERVRKYRAAGSSEPGAGTEQPSGGDAGARSLMQLWNEKADKALPRCSALSHNRLRMASARAAERSLDEYAKLIDKMNSIPGLLGQAGDRKWKADFDWFIHPMSLAKLAEGKYDNWGTKNKEPALKVVQHGTDIYDE